MSATDESRKSDATTTEGAAAGPSPMYAAFLRRVKIRRKLILLCQIVLLVLFFALWEVAPRAHWVNPMLTSYPSAIWSTFVELLGDPDNGILRHTWVTVLETFVGFTLSMLLGVGIAIMLWWWEFLYRVVDPFMVVANALPKIALVPIFYIWLGDVASIYAMAVAIAVFITILMIYSGFRETDSNKIKLVRTLGATQWQILRTVVLPSNVPVMVAALKINVGLALVGVIVGEFQAAKAGLGYLIIFGSQVFQMTLVMTAITMLAIISTIMYLAIMYLENTVMRHHR